MVLTETHTFTCSAIHPSRQFTINLTTKTIFLPRNHDHVSVDNPHTSGTLNLLTETSLASRISCCRIFTALLFFPTSGRDWICSWMLQVMKKGSKCQRGCNTMCHHLSRGLALKSESQRTDVEATAYLVHVLVRNKSSSDIMAHCLHRNTHASAAPQTYSTWSSSGKFLHHSRWRPSNSAANANG